MRNRTTKGLLAGLVVALSLMTPSRAHALAAVRAVRRIIAPATTRLIVEFSQPVDYRIERAAGRPELGVPPRLYVDFLDARQSSALGETVVLPEGPLVRLHFTQRSAAITRLILDVPGLSDFGVFPMLDPFRLVIDVRGTPRVNPVKILARAGALAPVSPPAGSTRTSALAPASALPVRRRIKVVLDPGHGGKDPGAIGTDGVAEKDVVLRIAQVLRDRLRAYPSLDVVLTRDRDVFLPLEERTARANAESADLFISIHANASVDPTQSGVETYFLNNTNDRATIRLAEMENGLRQMTGRRGRDRDVALILSDLIQSYKVNESSTLADDIQGALVGALDAPETPVNNLGVKRGPFYVLVGAGMPCVLVEVSFITNPLEGRRLADPRYQQAIAAGLLRGIRRFVENTYVAGNL